MYGLLDKIYILLCTTPKGYVFSVVGFDPLWFVCCSKEVTISGVMSELGYANHFSKGETFAHPILQRVSPKNDTDYVIRYWTCFSVGKFRSFLRWSSTQEWFFSFSWTEIVFIPLQELSSNKINCTFDWHTVAMVTTLWTSTSEKCGTSLKRISLKVKGLVMWNL